MWRGWRGGIGARWIWLRGAALPDGGEHGSGWSRPERGVPIWCEITTWRAAMRGGRRQWLVCLWALTGGGVWAWGVALGPFSPFVFRFLFLVVGLESGFTCRILNKLGVSRVAGSSIRHHVWEAIAYLLLGLCKRVTHDCFFPSISLEAIEVPIVGVLLARWCIVVYMCVMESHDIISGLCIQGFRFYVPPCIRQFY